MRSRRAGAALGLAVGVFGMAVSACATSGPPDEAPWKTGSVDVMTAAPDAGGPLSFRNCPTLAEAQAAVPQVAGGPQVNAVPFKTMLLQCSYTRAAAGGAEPSTLVAILVFDASAEGPTLWDSVRTDPARTNVVDVPALGDRSFATGSGDDLELWVVRGAYGLHLYESSQAGITLTGMTALARAMLAGLERAPR